MSNPSTIESFVGNTPLVRLRRLGAGGRNQLLAKVEGNNPTAVLIAEVRSPSSMSKPCPAPGSSR